VSALLARQTLARFAWQFPDNPRLLGYPHRVNTPTLIIWGERDGFVPIAHGKAYLEAIPQAQLVMVPNASHLPHIEQPAVCQEAILNFLKAS